MSTFSLSSITLVPPGDRGLLTFLDVDLDRD